MRRCHCRSRLIESEEVDYLRGDQTHEQENGGLFRNRPSVIRAISFILHRPTNGVIVAVYVGANDGMLACL